MIREGIHEWQVVKYFERSEGSGRDQFEGIYVET
jgi:hypothetical protein